MKVGSSQGTGPYHIQAEINMIPLIDIALVLLIIFMVISPILVQSQLNVRLPHVTANAAQAESEAIKIDIDGQGRISLMGKIVTKEELKKSLSLRLPPGHHSSVLIQADKDVPFENVVFVMDLAKKFKVEKLGVAVIPQIELE